MDEVRLATADVVVASSTHVVPDGAVAWHGDRIVAVGEAAELLDAYPGALVAEHGRVAIFPSFVNAHTHLCLSYLAGEAPYDGNFASWLQTVLHAYLEWSDEDHAASLTEGLCQSVHAGTGAAADIVNNWAAVPAYEGMPLGGTVFLQVTGFNPVVADVWTHNLEQAFNGLGKEDLKDGMRLGISPHAPYSTSAKLYRECQRLAEEHDVLLTTHLAETPEEEQFLRDGTGVYRRMLRERGTWVPRWRPPDMTPIEYLDSEGVLNDRCLYAHVNYPTESDLELLALRDATVVYCPRSHAFFGHKRHKMDRMVEMGIRVALGTDSLASNDSLGMHEEVKLVRRSFPDVPASKILKAGTVKGAEALRVTDDYGTLEPGKKASLLVADLGAAPDPEKVVEQFLAPEARITQVVAWGRDIH